MIEIWQECASFQTTNQRLADQVRTLIKKGWFPDLEILEMHQKTYKQDNNTVPDTSRVVKQKTKKNLTEMNCQLRKMKKSLNKTMHNQVTLKKHCHKNKR